jgi:hypothetical protein
MLFESNQAILVTNYSASPHEGRIQYRGQKGPAIAPIPLSSDDRSSATARASVVIDTATSSGYILKRLCRHNVELLVWRPSSFPHNDFLSRYSV